MVVLHFLAAKCWAPPNTPRNVRGIPWYNTHLCPQKDCVPVPASDWHVHWAVVLIQPSQFGVTLSLDKTFMGAESNPL